VLPWAPLIERRAEALNVVGVGTAPGQVHALSLNAATGTVFIGGEFTHTGGAERHNWAAVDAITGDVRPPVAHTSHPVQALRDNGSGWRQRARLWWTARTAEWVVVPSEHTKQRLLQCHPRLADRVRVVPHGIEAARFAMAPADVVATCARIGVQRDGYFLVLGQLRQRKNLAFLLHAYQRACELHADLPPLHRVGPPGRFVPEELLPALLAGARALVYPSLSEGFGLPPLEAMAAGTPVLASDRGAIPEVVGDAALLCSVDDQPEFAKALVRIHRDEELRERLRQRGAQRVAQFTPEATARHWLELWREVGG
jgi:alpha-1,3-rhamnosyl/mannosyltransferase